MKNLKNLTVLIVTYNTSEKILINCINSIDKKVKILIVENSNDFKHKKKIKKFRNVKFICSGKNLGYGNGNNYGLKRTSTRYVLILNPDIMCDTDLFNNISKLIKKKINFHVIGCQYLKDKIFMPAGFFDKYKNEKFRKEFKKNVYKDLTNVDWVTGCSMLIDLNKFNSKNIFDKNYFLYFEETDLCKTIIKKGGKVFTNKDFKVHHLGFKSSLGRTSKDVARANIIREWHWMWSSFYFYKKHNNYLYACYKLKGKFFKSFLKMIFYFLFFKKDLKEKYKFRFLGILSSLLNRSAHFRG
jgi:N-acetylglucosaminyl-diphospho-decaprenol L-rhamnosyltransferase